MTEVSWQQMYEQMKAECIAADQQKAYVEKKYSLLIAAFRVNMILAYPEMTHTEVDAQIERATKLTD